MANNRQEPRDYILLDDEDLLCVFSGKMREKSCINVSVGCENFLQIFIEVLYQHYYPNTR